MMLKPVASEQMFWILQISLGMLFVVSALGKLEDPWGFMNAVEDFRILPRRLAHLFGGIVIASELLCGTAQLTGLLVFIAIPSILCLLLSFFVAVLINIRRGNIIECYCFGRGGDSISVRTLIRLILTMSGEAILLFNARGLRTTWESPPFATIADLIVGIAGALLLLICTFWTFHVQDVAFLIRRAFKPSFDGHSS